MRTGMAVFRDAEDRRTALVEGMRACGVMLKNCRSAVTVKGMVEDARFLKNRVHAQRQFFNIEPPCKSQVTEERNECQMSGSESGQARDGPVKATLEERCFPKQALVTCSRA